MHEFTPIEELIKKYGKPKAILLDWDNTLADSWRIIHKSLNCAFRELGMQEWSFEDIVKGRDNIHHSLRESFPILFGDKWEQAREIYYKNFLEVHIQEIQLLPGAMETLSHLQGLDVHLSIVSNKTGQYLRDELKHLGIHDFFHTIIGAGDATKDKPHADPLIMALHNSNIEQKDYQQKVWMVGDSKTDIEAAINAKCVPVIFGDADVSKYLSKNEIAKIDSHTHFQEVAKNLK